MTTDQNGQMGASESGGARKSGSKQGEGWKPSYADLEMLARSLAYCNLDREQDDDGHTFHAGLVDSYETLQALIVSARDVLRVDDPPYGDSPCRCAQCGPYLETGVARGGAR